MKAKRGESAGGAAALMVFCIFAMLAFAVLMLGAGAYRSIAATSREASDERLSLSYIWTRVKNNDDVGMVYVTVYNGNQALFIEEKVGQQTYHTIIYHHDGWIREVFTEAGNEFKPGAGTRILQASELRFQQQENGSIEVATDAESIIITPRGAAGIPLPKGGG